MVVMLILDVNSCEISMNLSAEAEFYSAQVFRYARQILLRLPNIKLAN